MIILSIPKELAGKIKSIPERPGIYQMKDSQGNIIYIGKSKSLSKRVRSYFQTKANFNKIKQMVFNIHDIDFIVTDTHLEAQLLECCLIKKYRPIYNSQFKNHKKYVYLIIEDDNSFNPLSISLERKNVYSFGPYRSRNILVNLVKLFHKIYPIKKGLYSYEFNYHPLPLSMKKDDFEENRKALVEILSQGESMEEFLSKIKAKMGEASSLLQFERASYYRDLLSSLKYLYHSNKMDITKDKKILVGERLDDGYKLFYIVDGNLVWKKKFHRIHTKDIEDFLSKAKKFENYYIFNKDEKSALDFKAIINRELRTNSSMLVEYLNKEVDLNLLINFLKTLKTTN